MRILLSWTQCGPEIEELLLELKRNSHKVVYWLGFSGGVEKKYPEIIFHNHPDAWVAKPAPGVDTSQFPAPGVDLIEKLYHDESLILTMMNRKCHGMQRVDERKHLYYNLLQYWNGVLKKYKPDAIVYAFPPHSSHDYVIYSLAKLFRIKTLMFESTWQFGKTIMYEDFRKGSQVLCKEIESNRGKHFSIEDLSNDLREHYIQGVDKNRDATPIYMKEGRRQYTGVNLFLTKLKITGKHIKRGKILKSAMGHLNKRLKQNTKKEYLKFQCVPDLSKKFIYVPLQYQPEYTTSPMGDVFVDQILMLEVLSSALPDDWVIYTKEHPAQWWFHGINYADGRYPGYYTKILKLKNVSLIPVSTSAFDLIYKAQAVATVTGTAGWEALLNSKPPLIFGLPWYRDCPGVFRVNNVESCKVAFNRIKNGFRINQQDIINYLKSVDNINFDAFIINPTDLPTKISRQESMSNMTKRVIEALK